MKFWQSHVNSSWFLKVLKLHWSMKSQREESFGRRIFYIKRSQILGSWDHLYFPKQKRQEKWDIIFSQISLITGWLKDSWILILALENKLLQYICCFRLKLQLYKSSWETFLGRVLGLSLVCKFPLLWEWSFIMRYSHDYVIC